MVPTGRFLELAATRYRSAAGSRSLSIRIDLSSCQTAGPQTRRGPGGIEVPLPGRTEAAIDQFVSTLWDHIATWGIAGKGMYWRPVVDLYVVPDAAWRADQLKKLLDGSGLELVDKGAVVR